MRSGTVPETLAEWQTVQSGKNRLPLGSSGDFGTGVMRGAVRALLALGMGVGLAAAGLVPVQAASAGPAFPSWRYVWRGTFSGSNYLAGVTTTGPDHAWAVGAGCVPGAPCPHKGYIVS